MMKKYPVIWFLFVLMCLKGYGQTSIRHQIVPIKAVDSLDINYYSKKNFWGAIVQSQAINGGLLLFNRYVQNKDYAHVTFKTVRDNLKKGFVWDNDAMATNMFGHPYHGSLYFNSARSRGFNYWESGLFAAGGSLTWELFCEREYPSINDITATPIGGMALGEALYRASDMILDDRARGSERTWREISAFIVNPMRGLTRFINGDMTRKRSTSGRQFGIPQVSVETALGVRAIELQGEVLDKGVGAVFEVDIEYGDRFDDECKRPFDYFTLRGSINLQKDQPILGQVNLTGRLWVTDVIDNSKDFLSLGFYQHFDYYDSDTISGVTNKIPYKLGTPAAVGIGFMHKSKRFRYWVLDSYAHVNGILLGASLSDHYRVYERDYNLGSGFGVQAGTNITFRNFFSASATYELYKIFTWKGYPKDVDWDNINEHEFNYQGDHSQALLQILCLRTQLRVWERFYLTGSYNFFVRDTNYKYYENMRSRTHEGKLMLTYKF